MLDFILLLLIASFLKDENVKIYSFTIPLFQNTDMKTTYRNSQNIKKGSKSSVQENNTKENIITVPFTEVKDDD